MLDQDLNPYAPPESGNPALAVSDAMVIRQHLLRTERTLKMAGVVFASAGVVVFTAGVLRLEVPLERLSSISVGQGGDRLLAGGATVLCGLGLLRLDRWAWKGCIGLCFFYMAVAMSGLVIHWPIGLAVYGAVLSFLFTSRARYVMSRGYRDIIALTPELKSRVSSWAIYVAGVVSCALGWVLHVQGRF